MDETPQSQTPSLSNLPVDLAARCLEFLPFDTVRGAKRGVKRVSRGMRSAARRALTRGRWRPIMAIQQEIFDDIQRQLDEDWEAEHGWKYGPSGDKFWEEDGQEMLGLA